MTQERELDHECAGALIRLAHQLQLAAKQAGELARQI